MSVPRRMLAEGEDVVAELRPHWLFVARPLAWTIVLAAAILAVAVAVPSAPLWVLTAPLVVLGLVVLWLLARVLRWKTITLAVTTSRIVERSGIIARRGLDIRLDRIGEVWYDQSLLERLVGAGEVVVETVGEHGEIVLGKLRHPADVQRLLGDLVGQWRQQWGPSASTTASGGWGPAPNGQWRSPPGERPSPTGKWPSPTGQSSLPTGEWPSPTGGWPSPTGEWPSPTGEWPSPTGEWPSPTGEWPTGEWPSPRPRGRRPAPQAPVVASTPPRGVPRAGRSVGDRLQELQELHRRGLISDEELADKRRHLLDQL